MRPDCPALPPVIGHRGAAMRAPENTLAGFRRAKALGCRWVEFDVRLTADGVPVVCHDDRLERATGHPGRISALPFMALSDIDAGAPFDVSFVGEPIPSFAAVIALARELGLGINVELKTEPGSESATATAAAECLARFAGGLPPLLVSSFSTGALAAMRRVAPAYPRGLLLSQIPPDWRGMAEALDCASIHVDHKRLRCDIARAVRAAGYSLLAYTVNDAGRARQLFDWGVTSVFSDVPDIILAMIDRDVLCASSAAGGVATTMPFAGFVS